MLPFVEKIAPKWLYGAAKAFENSVFEEFQWASSSVSEFLFEFQYVGGTFVSSRTQLTMRGNVEN